MILQVLRDPLRRKVKSFVGVIDQGDRNSSWVGGWIQEIPKKITSLHVTSPKINKDTLLWTNMAIENPTILMVFTKKDGDFYGRAASFRECKQFQLVWSRNIPKKTSIFFSTPPRCKRCQAFQSGGEGEWLKLPVLSDQNWRLEREQFGA